MMGVGQLNIALRVGQGLMPHPLLEDGEGYAPQDAVAAVGVAEGVGVGSGWINPGNYAVNVELVGTKNRSTPGNLRPSLPAGHNYLPTVPEPVGGDLSDSHSATIGRIQPERRPRHR